ncbi:hypothetical protein CC1G_06454 [Coprinopsis cinerea okayama7|uniref:C2H2-type domain-containing protein n=1 Tax=Coprinopsis cinerea (strain Okayama-7 / 130 / ATCC MYA-4618 / FGSC 9003) TaxID=240176 RepID=A8NN57_COPC7|nr:hypothetical protein CC1G_06454 [Coprinopsis cinerea okayama7\|eukprot:XP_001835051.2 hypothetical protein CC1G_06454 [Coprinopsis cinerea okayama7\
MMSPSEEHINAALKRLERLTCRLCNSVFPTRNALFEHIPTHAMDKPSVSQTPQPIERLTCRLCDTVFPTRDALFAHIPIHAMDKPSGNRKPQPVERLTCRVCGMVCPTRNALFQHIPIHQRGDMESDTLPVVTPPPVQPVQEPAPFASPFAERNPDVDLTAREPGAVDFYPVVVSPVPFHPASPPRTYRGGQAPSSTRRHTPYVRTSESRYNRKHPSHTASGNGKPQPIERLTCKVCGTVFPTRNALFQHIPIHEQGDAKSDTPPVVAPPPVQPVQEPAPLASPFAERNKNADLTREPGAVDFYPIVASPVPFHPASPPRTYRGGQAPSSTYRHTPYVRPSASRYSLKHPSKAVSIGDVRQSNLARRRARRQAPLPEVPMDWEPTYAEVTIRAETDDFEKFGRMKNAPFKLPRPQPKKHNKKTSRSAH